MPREACSYRGAFSEHIIIPAEANFRLVDR
jgi:hypothetical protein